jgi:hypothetical protein
MSKVFLAVALALILEPAARSSGLNRAALIAALGVLAVGAKACEMIGGQLKHG